jgi:ssDNA-binding Zn-finger/Zn-ribbon topoisomerase 1
MSSFLIIPSEKCPKCGKYAILSAHHYDGKEDRYGWVGKRCPYCGYEERNEKETQRMIEEFKKLERAIKEASE